VADQIAARDPQVRVLHRTHKAGLGAAYMQAFSELWRRAGSASCRWTRISRTIRPMCRGCCRHWKKARTWPWGRATCAGRHPELGTGRRLISRGGGVYARMALGVGVHDLTAGFKAWKAATLQGIDMGQSTPAATGSRSR